ncbi:GRXC6 [Symbiodinium pilosum]|uniref:GRXC6 protein n=1 Tax=Symbiodinium pilosum TaxID=2952 RepID=A0A812Y9P8_SYMPI|nr:GRXC6 [Symbiodinium pilosum]
MAKKSPTGFLLCSALFLSTAFVGSPGPKLPARQLSVRKSSEDAALATVADAGASPLLAPLKVASLGMGLLKPIFAAEAKLQALSYDEAEIQAKIQEEVKSAPVVVYTYGLSPFCTEATKLLDSIGAEYKEIQLAPEWFLMLGENAAKRAELGAIYGRTSMPHIFIGGESIGGLMEGPGLVPLYESGELMNKLQAAGAFPSQAGKLSRINKTL